jgi:hypothetical protein
MRIKTRLDQLEKGNGPSSSQGLAALLTSPAKPSPTRAELEAYVAHRQQEGRGAGLSGLLLEEMP